MEIDLTQTLIGLDGEPLQVQERDGDKMINVDLVLGKVLVESLMATYKNEEMTLSGQDKVKRYKLAQKIHGAEVMQFSAEDISLLKELISKLYSTLVVGIVWEMLDVETLKLEKSADA